MISKSLERKIVFLFCLLAAVHVFIFSAAFPFFNNVDEQTHFDLVTRYASGDLPRRLDPPHEEAMPYLAIFNTPEYLWAPDTFPDGKIPPPPWTLPMEQINLHIAAVEMGWSKVPNHEVAQPPLYYALAGGWWRLGKSVGFHDGFLLYWLRFLNVVFVVLLVWLAHLTARQIFPDNLFLRLGVPALIAFLPQTAFYSINNDVLSPLCFGAAFFCLVKFFSAETPGVLWGALTGVALAATVLAKTSNLPLLAVSAVAVAGKIVQWARTGTLRATFPSWLALVVAAALPIGLWLAWTRHAFGDFTGTAAKIQMLGWAHKPVGEWWSHPIFTPRGLWTFISGLTATFWQGEFLWHRVPLALPAVDLIYVVFSLVFVGLALVSLRPGPAAATQAQRLALWFGFAGLAAGIAFLGFLSIIYDFQSCFYPSRAHPYFTSGRLLLGSLIPFSLLCLYGLDRALDAVKINRIRPLVLAALILFMLASEIAVDWPVFANPYNWFHM